MNRTKNELLLECIKQFEHIENVLGYNRFSTTRSLIDEINQALTMPAVVGQSEQLPYVYSRQLKKIDQLNQTQQGLDLQLNVLKAFANKLGLYDASDYISTNCK